MDYIVYGVQNCSLEQIFECGQAFRFNQMPDGSYSGVAMGKKLRVSQNGGDIVFHDTSADEFANIWEHYFDLHRDYSAIIGSLSQDPIMAEACRFGSGIRILRQDLFECIITFILSQQNNIPRIKNLVSKLCDCYGGHIDDHARAFPLVEALAQATPGALRQLGCGFRADYISDTARKIADGKFDMTALESSDTPTAREYLMTLKGVGPKVADCILLFGAGKFDAFPIDVWIGRAISILYHDIEFDPVVFGPYCGIAQQYLFYYARETKIGRDQK